MAKRKRMTYKSAGVDIDRAESLLAQLVPTMRSADRPGVVGSIGGFSGLFEAPGAGMERPMLVAATDGVGTKLLVAQAQQRHDTVGIDLVAMCANDLVCCGAEPLFFLDYFATGGLSDEAYRQVIEGVVDGCKQAGCALLGGETAEMPDMYPEGDYDLAGFCVGVVDGAKLIDGSRVRPGDRLVGIESSGLHSNGFSLARKVFTPDELAGDAGRKLLPPTIIYVRPVLALAAEVDVLGLANITGGGLPGNLPRCLPEGAGARIDRDAWQVPEIFHEIQQRGNVDEAEMFRTFNMGIGMVAVVRAEAADRAVELLGEHRVRACMLGEVIEGNGSVEL